MRKLQARKLVPVNFMIRVMGKTLERLLSNRVSAYINRLLAELQFGL